MGMKLPLEDLCIYAQKLHMKNHEKFSLLENLPACQCSSKRAAVDII